MEGGINSVIELVTNTELSRDEPRMYSVPVEVKTGEIDGKFSEESEIAGTSTSQLINLAITNSTEQPARDSLDCQSVEDNLSYLNPPDESETTLVS